MLRRPRIHFAFWVASFVVSLVLTLSLESRSLATLVCCISSTRNSQAPTVSTSPVFGKPPSRCVTQPLTVVPDPRIKLPQRAYDEQFLLAKEIEEERALVETALQEAGELAKKNPNDPRLREIADLTPEGVWWLAPSSTTSLRFIEGALGNLAGVVDSADTAPTADAKASWAKLKPAADTVLARWREYKGTIR